MENKGREKAGLDDGESIMREGEERTLVICWIDYLLTLTDAIKEL